MDVLSFGGSRQQYAGLSKEIEVSDTVLGAPDCVLLAGSSTYFNIHVTGVPAVATGAQTQVLLKRNWSARKTDVVAPVAIIPSIADSCAIVITADNVAVALVLHLTIQDLFSWDM